MAGRAYDKWGNKRHISHRIGDNRGNPYVGPLSFHVLSAERLVLMDKTKSIHIQHLSDALEYHIYPEYQRSKVEAMLQEQELTKDLDDENWAAKYLSSETNLVNQSRVQLQHHYLDMKPVAMSAIPAMNQIVIADDRNCIKVINIDTMEIIHSFGSAGYEPGDISCPTAICGFNVGKTPLVALGDSGGNQRVQIYDYEGKCLAHIGGKGPLLGQFREITCIASFNSFETKYSFKHSYINIDTLYKYHHIPSWYKGVIPMDELEECLMDDVEHERNFFVVGQRPNDPSLHDIVYLTPAKSLGRFTVKHDNAGITGGYFINNLLVYSDENRVYYPCLYDVIEAQHQVLKIKGDARDFVLLAVVDRKNFRIQILKFYFTSSFIFKPTLRVIASIGGSKNMICELRDPVAAAYAKHGELAVCDNGKNMIYLFSKHLQFIKVIQLPFLSIQQLKVKSRRKQLLTPIELENSRKPCWVGFTTADEMIMTYKSGGLYIFETNRGTSVGNLDYLDLPMLKKVVCDYLHYEDICNVRNSCRFLHNFTKSLRLHFQIFPPPRRPFINKIISLFLTYCRIGPLGTSNLKDVVLHDQYYRPICQPHLWCRCVVKHCPDSHLDVEYDRFDIQVTDAYLVFDTFMYFVGEVYGPKFIWKFELFIQALFQAYGHEEQIILRKDPMSRKNEVVRELTPVKTHVLKFYGYLEVMTALEEHFSGYKDFNKHKLFDPNNRARFLPNVPTNLESLNKETVFMNPLDQYDSHGIDIPPNKFMHGKRFIAKRGFENAERRAKDSKDEHIQTVNRHMERATTLIDKLFK